MFEGTEAVFGTVSSQSRFRIELNEEEARQLLFWDYYSVNWPKPRWGSGLFRYINDIQAAQILNKICKIKRNSSERKLANDFLKHFCDTHGINIDNLPEPNGILITKGL